MQPYPRSPDLVWPGHLHGTGCLSARAVGTGFPTVVRRLCLGPVGSWVWVLLTPPVLAGVLGGCVWARFVVLSLFCRLFVVFVVGLWFRPAFGTCVVSWAPRLPPAVSGSGVRCGRVCWAQVSAVPSPSWLGCRGVFFALLFFLLFFFFGLCGPCPSIPFLSGWAGGSLFFFSVSVSLLPVGRCYWLGVAGFGWVVPLCLCGGPVFGAFWGGGLAVCGGVGGRFGGCGLFSCLFPLPPPFFFGGGGLACSSLYLPWAGARTGLHSVLSSGLLSSVAFCVAAFRPHGSGGLCTRWARRPFLPGLVLALPAGRLR